MGERNAASQLISVLHAPAFHVDISERIPKNMKNCKEVF